MKNLYVTTYVGQRYLLTAKDVHILTSEKWEILKTIQSEQLVDCQVWCCSSCGKVQEAGYRFHEITRNQKPRNVSYFWHRLFYPREIKFSNRKDQD